jgi:pimeloyl-ACP methyl ester carboxylesterase
MITRHFLPLANGHQVHYRRAGHGPPLLILHPSPNSSALMVPQIDAFAPHFTCIALDTPGYGLSTDFIDDPTELWAYADAMVSILDALGIGAAAVYGAATGGQIATQLARRYPQRVPLVMLDSVGDFSGALDHVAEGYFQDITPRRDGTHLLRVWDMCRHLFVAFPWHSARGGDRLDVGVPAPTVIQQYVNDYLRAGPGYAKAYRAAMDVERWENTREIPVPTLLVRNGLSAVVKHTDALIARGLPDHITVVRADGPDRLTALAAAAVASGRVAGLPAPPPPPTQTSSAVAIQNMHIPVSHKGRSGSLRARVCFAGAGRPLLALHDPAGSAALVEPMLLPYVGKRPVIALDLPGNGESDNIIDPANITSAAYAEIVVAALDALGLSEVDVIGRYSGAPVGMEMSFQRPALVKHLVQAAFMLFEGAEQAELLAHYTPSVAPRWDGSHLVTGWGIMRDQALFWPWFKRTRAGIIWADAQLDPALIHTRVVELMKIGDQYQKAYGAAWTYPMRTRLPQLTVPTLVCAPGWEPIFHKTALAAEIAPQVGIAELPARMADWHRVLDGFFGS